VSQQSDRNDADASVSPPPADPKSFEEMATIAAETQVMSAGIEGPIPSAPTGDLPRSIGHYRILRKLGEGGMGIVYEAEQQNPRRRVALKVIRGGRFVDDATIRMFRREAETLARLRHPNIGAIYESGRTEEGQHFFASWSRATTSTGTSRTVPSRPPRRKCASASRCSGASRRRSTTRTCAA